MSKTKNRWAAFLLVALIQASLLMPTSILAESRVRKVIYPRNRTLTELSYSPAILVGETLYVSGLSGQGVDGRRPELFGDEAKQCLVNVREILQAAGMSFENTVWMNVYLTDLADLEATNKIYWEMIGGSPPARTVLGIAALPQGSRIVINCIAMADAGLKKAVWPTRSRKAAQADPPGILAKDVLYISAQGSQDIHTGKHPLSFTDQVRKALDNMGDVLRSAGMTHKNLVWVNPYMVNFKLYGEMNKVYETYFEFGNTPARGSINVVRLPGDDQVVFSGIAGGDLSKRKAYKPFNMPPSSTASPGVMYRDTLYLSAKSGFIPSQGIVTSDLRLQLRQTMRNLLDGLEEARMDFSDVVWSTVYLKDMNAKDQAQMNDLYESFFGADRAGGKALDYNERMGHKTTFKDGPPPQTTLQQSFDKDTKTEEQISFIAVKTEK